MMGTSPTGRITMMKPAAMGKTEAVVDTLLNLDYASLEARDLDYASLEARVLALYGISATPYGKHLIREIQKREKENMEKTQGSMISDKLSMLADYVISGIGSAPMPVPAQRKRQKSKIIKRVVKDGRIYELHATKGWRSRRI